MLPEKGVHLQLSSEQSVADVGITQLDWKRVPQARSGGCKCSVVIVRGTTQVETSAERREITLLRSIARCKWRGLYECGPLLQTWRGLHECGLLLHARGVVCV